MNTSATVEQLHQLRLKAMAQHYRSVIALPIHQQPEAHALIAQLVEQEQLHRSNKKTELLLAASKLRHRNHIGQITYSLDRNLNKETIAVLAQNSYIQQAQNIIITGATGCGKSFIACALGHNACTHGYSVLYYNMNSFTDKLHYSKLDGTYNQLLKKLINIKLLIIDDFGIKPLTPEAKYALLQIIEQRHETKSIIIAAQLPVSNWYDYINEPTLADAILDRLTAQSHRIELKGKSLRNKINNA
jgi:DNA replication protein DnaC